MEDLIYEPPAGQRYWVVRANNGKFLPHFRKFGLISIGHLDGVLRGSATTEKFFQSWEKNLSLFAQYIVSNKFSDNQRRSMWSQVEDFSIEMQVGDLVIVPAPGILAIGRITSGVFVDDSAKVIVIDEGQPYETKSLLETRLHRKVSWGPIVQRSLANAALRRALGSHRTTFSVDEYWREFHHILYPFFKKNDDIYFSLRIKRIASVTNVAVTKVFSVLSEIEALARTPKLPASADQIEDLVDRLEERNKLNLSVKAHFMSPGEIWGAASALTEPVLYYLIYSGVFGSSKLGWKGFVDPRKVPAALGRAASNAAVLMSQRIKEKKIDKAIQDLQIEENNVNTKRLTDVSHDVQDVVVKPDRTTGRKPRKTKVDGPSDLALPAEKKKTRKPRPAL